MSSDRPLPLWARRLAELRRARAWSAADLACELKRLREGLPSVRSLAHMIQLDWETGRHRPGPRYRLLLAAVFDADEQQIFGDRTASKVLLSPVGRYDAELSDVAAIDGQGALGEQRGPVAPELVDYFGSQLAGHYSADRFLGPMRLIPTAVSQYELLCDLANAARDGLRGDLWSLATGYAAFIGWLYQDTGELGTAASWLDVMIERAHRSQDIQLVGFALHNKAMLHADMKDGPGVLDLTGAALQHRARLCPKVQVLALQQAAHGACLAGGDDVGDVCDRLLDDATGLVDAIDDEYPWGGSCQTPRYVEVQRATCYGRLGRTRDALELWGQIIPGIPVSSRRDAGVFRARQAQAFADAGEPDQAIAVAGEVVPLIAQTGSARMRGELFALRQRMEQWSDEPRGRALDEMLSGIPTK
jgi:transcriptional regulator with XRE-family HTH domain